MSQPNPKITGVEISLVHDLELNQEGALWVVSEKDYVKACKTLAGLLGGFPKLLVFVRQKVHFLWLEHFANQIGLPVTVSEKTALDILSETWKVTLPDWLDDQAILTQKLLEIKPPQGLPADFTGAILAIFLGPVFKENSLDPEKIVDLVEALIDPAAKEALEKYPIVQRCLEEKCQEWAANSTHSWLAEVLGESIKNVEQLWKNLSIWILLAGYPEKLLEYAVSLNQAITIKKVPPKYLTRLNLNRVAVQQATDQIEFFFKDIQGSVHSNIEFRDIANRASGRLMEEFKFLVALLESKQFPPAKEDIEVVQEKFKDCPGLSRVKLDNLNHLIPVSEPSKLAPGETWDFKKWVHWTIQEYLPFRQWQVNQRQGSPTVEETVQGFTDWYLKEYTILHQNNELSLTHVLNCWKQFINEDGLTLIVMIDCLPANYWTIMEDCLRKAGFYQHHLEYRLAPLPSETNNNKPLLISGNWEVTGSDYRQLFSQRVIRDWPQKQFFYHTSLKELMEMEFQEGPAFVALNFYITDEVLHSDVGIKGSTYEEELHRLFINLGETLKSISDRWAGDPGKLSLYIITDHGATRLLDAETQSFDAKIVDKLLPIEKYRYGKVEENEADQIPKNLWDFGYRFKPPFLSKGPLFFIPRGHNTVKTGGTGGYKHGGATPEEVIVPIGIFKSSPLPWKDPGLRLVGLHLAAFEDRAVFYVQRLTTITIEVQNNNPEPLRVNRIEILSPPCDLKNYEKPLVPSHGQSSMRLDCYFSGKAQSETELIIELGYEAQGEGRVGIIKVPAEFKTAVTGGFSLKDLKTT